MNKKMFELLSDTDAVLREIRAENLDGSEPAIGELLDRNTELFQQRNKPREQASLTDWRVYYRAEGDDEVQSMRFSADGMEHAIEQFTDACSPGDRMVGALQELSCFNILPVNTHEFTMPKHAMTWIAHRNLSIHILDREDHLRVEVLPLGREDEGDIERLDVSYSHAALDALIDRDDDADSIYQRAEGRSAVSLKAHLAELEGDGEGIHDRVKSALGDLLK